MKRIPLRARDGSVRAYAQVDDEDYERISAHRWCLHGAGYAHRREAGGRRWLLMHREVLATAPGIDVDHINGDKLDNQRANLRPARRAQNIRNQRLHTNNTSGHRGVWWHRQCRKWVAEIMVDRRKVSLGLFENINDAVAARTAAATRLHGEFARTE